MPAAMLHCVSHDEMFGSHNILAAHGRGGLVTLTRQSNQSAFQQKGFFAARGVCPANQAKPGLQYFCPGDPCDLRPRMQNIAMPCRAHGLHRFA
jgi:hypothetical protein